MPDYELEQVDKEGEGKCIDLPSGDSVIGRGLFLGVSDKRVSRNHGILENVDGRLRLKPTHVNPCFVQTSLDASAQPLEKDKWHCLKDGSIFSLLPGKHVYRVRAAAEERTPRNSQGFEQEDEVVSEAEHKLGSSRSCEETLAYTPQAKNTFTYDSEMRDESRAAGPSTLAQVGGDSHSSCKPDSTALLTPRKSRTLPAWMMDVAPVNTSSPKAKRAPPARTATPGPKRPRASRLPPSSGDEEEERAAEEAPRKRAKRLESDPEESQDQVPVSGRQEDAENTGAARKSDVGEQKSVKPGGSGPESSGNASAREKAEARRRTACPYGTSCYRKNPVHFRECSHPGDSDYEDEQSDDDHDADRPECPYGTDCYRKNPLHKKEYKHTKPPARRTAPLTDEEDEDQYENSFINDDSEEEDGADEDSDYVPESEDSGKEDIKRLRKEAKAFLKRKK